MTGMKNINHTVRIVGLAAVASLFTLHSRAADAGMLLADTETGITQFQTGGGGDGTNLGSFITGGAGGTYRRMVFGADRTGDSVSDLFVSTDSASIKIFNGVTGAFDHTLAGTSYSGLRSLAVDSSNNDLYLAAFGPFKVARYAANETDKPAPLKSNADFITDATNQSNNVIGVRVGPDGKVYTAFSSNLYRYGTSGALEKTVAISSSTISTMVFGPDVTSDGKLEMYVVDTANTKVRVFDVLSNPASWTELANAKTGFTAPVSVAFDGNDMYMSDYTAGTISRYQLSGGSWVNNPKAGNSGAIFASGLSTIQDLVFVPAAVPEPATGGVLLLSCVGLALRRQRAGR